MHVGWVGHGVARNIVRSGNECQPSEHHKPRAYLTKCNSSGVSTIHTARAIRPPSAEFLD
eukprot:2996660-Alexandrium_andersonii.AAC.1